MMSSLIVFEKKEILPGNKLSRPSWVVALYATKIIFESFWGSFQSNLCALCYLVEIRAVPLNQHCFSADFITEADFGVAQIHRAKDPFVGMDPQLATRGPVLINKKRSIGPQAGTDPLYLGIIHHISQSILGAGLGKWHFFITNDENERSRHAVESMTHL